MSCPRPEIPHVLAEWLPAPLAGEHACEWAVWFKVHHQDLMASHSSSDQDADPEHAALVDQHIAEWTEREYEVSTNRTFALSGRNAILTGTPELMVSRDDHTLIISIPTGPPLRSHGTLVRVWMYGLRRAHGPYHGMVLPGGLVYRDRIDRVPQGGVDQGLIRHLGALINRLVSDEPAARVPSAQECRSCAIAAADCPVRVASPHRILNIGLASTYPMRQAGPGATP